MSEFSGTNRAAEVHIARFIDRAEAAQSVARVLGIPSSQVYVMDYEDAIYMPTPDSAVGVMLIDDRDSRYPSRLDIAIFDAGYAWTVAESQALSKVLATEVAFNAGEPPRFFVVLPGQDPIPVEIDERALASTNHVILMPASRTLIDRIAAAVA